MENKIINGYKIETFGGFITIRHWMVFDKYDHSMGIYFKYGDAKTACLNNNFDDAYKGFLY